MTARSKSAGLSRGSVPDLRRVVDLHRHSTVTLTSAHQHGSVDQPASQLQTPATASTDTVHVDSQPAPHRRNEQPQTAHNGVVNNHHQHQQLTTEPVPSAASVQLDEVFKISQHVAVSTPSRRGAMLGQGGNSPKTRSALSSNVT